MAHKLLRYKYLTNITKYNKYNLCCSTRLKENKYDFNTNKLLLHHSKYATICSRSFSNISSEHSTETLVDSVTYERVCGETLEALCDYFEVLVEEATNLNGTDVAYGDGVLTINLGDEHGIYVINRQTPNKQIWLSSPTSGPKRYDFMTSKIKTGQWIYKHNNESLHDLLQREISAILGNHVNFQQLPYA